VSTTHCTQQYKSAKIYITGGFQGQKQLSVCAFLAKICIRTFGKGYWKDKKKLIFGLIGAETFNALQNNYLLTYDTYGPVLNMAPSPPLAQIMHSPL
jgi:hypothetical protein